MEYQHLFATYEMVEPPTGRSKSNTEIPKVETKNFTLYPMTITVDNPQTSYDIEDYPGVISPFEYQGEESISLIPEEEIEQTDDIATGVVNLARSLSDKPYRWGANSPSVGFDCSGLIYYVYKQYGINLPRTSHAMGKFGTSVTLSEAQPGDIIYTGSKGPSGGHVKMVSRRDGDDIYVIEAKNKRDGIQESLLTQTSNIRSIRRVINSDNVEHTSTNTETNGRFSSMESFITTLDSTYRKALIENDMDPNWAPMLVASASIESAWGASPSGSFNYGGVKVSDALKKAGVSYTNSMTTDYVQGQGNVKRSQPFRNFRSVEDYCNYMVKWLKSSSRYGGAFTLFNSNQPLLAWNYILRKGYGGGSESNILNYMNWMRSRYNKIVRTLAS